MEPDDLIVRIDERIDYTPLWGSGVTCAFFKNNEAVGLVNLPKGDVALCYMAHDLGLGLGADRVVWVMTGRGPDELTGQRFVIYLASNPTVYAARPILIDDGGLVIPAGGLQWKQPSGWLALLADLLPKRAPMTKKEVRERAVELRQKGAVVHI